MAWSARAWWRGTVLAVGLMGWLGGCAHFTSPVERGLVALTDRGFVPVDTQTPLKAWLKRPDARAPQAVLHVFLEGDGPAWWAQRLPPADPTPTTSVALPLAHDETHAAVAYLARPCQFLSAAARSTCPVAWWTSQRWGEAVVAMTTQALDGLLQASGARQLVLTGHSGGGTLALLVAARRHDVRCVVTVASPLDVQAWAQGQGVLPLAESLNPADLPRQATPFQARHLFGVQDRVVPSTAAGRYAQRLHPAQLVRVPQLGHSQGWVQWWHTPSDEQSALATWLQGCLTPA